MKNFPLKTADILLPKTGFEKWSVVACDQFTSDKEYWNDVENTVGNSYSTLRITLPEIYLEENDVPYRIHNINETMKKYLEDEIFNEYKDAVIYMERKQADGRIMQGIIAAVDLEEYDFNKGSKTPIRATEGTVLERIPPRVKIRQNAILELPHVILLINDKNKTVIENLGNEKNDMKKLYDFDLMKNGGHIEGYLINKDRIKTLFSEIEALADGQENPLLFAVGDGNHSLATAKQCYNNLKEQIGEDSARKSPARYALTQIINIHSPALDFEPIYRVLFGVDPEDVIKEAEKFFKSEEKNTDFHYFYGKSKGVLPVNIEDGKLTTGVIQEFIDSYISSHPNAKVDYIHGIEDIRQLAEAPNTIGFIYDGIGKDTLFDYVNKSGVLPRKTFSMGEGRDKRYYLEARIIK